LFVPSKQTTKLRIGSAHAVTTPPKVRASPDLLPFSEYLGVAFRVGPSAFE
jgi:hypothetical protein